MSVNSTWWMASFGAVLMLASSAANLPHSSFTGLHALGPAQDSITDERAYAAAVGTIGDSAIRRLDFFPTRAQLRIQTAFMSSSTDDVPFGDLASRGDAAARAIDVALERFASVTVPRDLKALDSELQKTLKDAMRASESLTGAARACQVSIASVNQCQVPLSGASSRLAKSYDRYLDVRRRIRAQVLDTDTHLAEFARR